MSAYTLTTHDQHVGTALRLVRSSTPLVASIDTQRVTLNCGHIILLSWVPALDALVFCAGCALGEKRVVSVSPFVDQSGAKLLLACGHEVFQPYTDPISPRNIYCLLDTSRPCWDPHCQEPWQKAAARLIPS